MPIAAPRPCRKPGCPALVRDGSGYCEQHQRQEAKAYDERRGTATQRGYGSAWRRIRDQVLREEPLCRRCAAQGRTTPATHVHHQDRDVGNCERGNLEPLCNACHEAEHKSERWRGRGGQGRVGSLGGSALEPSGHSASRAVKMKIRECDGWQTEKA